MPKQKLRLYRTVDTDNPKFGKYNGKPQMSYSAYTSWKEPTYKGAFIADKFLGIPDTGNIFTDFGTGVGEYLETRHADEVKISELLSSSDISIMDSVPQQEGTVFEREVFIHREELDYCLIGYIDEATPNDVAKINVIDSKTGSAKKGEYYAGSDYNQTRLYAYGLEQEGEEIGEVGVRLFHRKGNNITPGDKNVIRLEGTVEYIPTPYSEEETEVWLKDVDKVAKEISSYLTFYDKYFVD